MLVFEEASWNLQRFMNVREGMDMVVADRLKICADIGGAIVALHAYGLSIMRVLPCKSEKDIGFVHGDIKPQNVPVLRMLYPRRSQ